MDDSMIKLNRINGSLISSTYLLVILRSSQGIAHTASLLHRSGSLHIRHLGRQHQRTAVVAFVKIHEDLRRLNRLVFLDEVARFRQDL